METRNFTDRIEEASAIIDPFCHIRLDDFFPNSVYQQMLIEIPPLESCHQLRHKDAIGADNRSARLQFGFSPQEWCKISPQAGTFWVKVLGALLKPDVTETVRYALKEGMIRRYGSQWSKVRLKPVPWIVRDQTGYRIGIHPDHQGKVITMQIYLPSDDSQRSLGTVLYRQAKPLKHTTEARKPIHEEDQDKFEASHRMDFLPNTGYAFVVQKDSWHGVDKVEQPDGRSRDSLMIHYLQA